MKIRIGSGIDIHQMVEGRPLVIGGVTIPHDKGLLGHSDADVLIHAICDALLGAAGLEDIGFYFPDTSNEFKNIDSKILLERVMTLIEERGWRVGNVDCSLLLEKPKIKPHIPAMKEVLARLMKIEQADLAIKATTAEKLGYVGRQEGAQAFASVLLFG